MTGHYNRGFTVFILKTLLIISNFVVLIGQKKDMEEWAKSMNKKKVPGTPVAVTTTPVETKTVVASAATASLEAREAELKSYSSASASPVEFSFAKKVPIVIVVLKICAKKSSHKCDTKEKLNYSNPFFLQ
jgi:hypothetical protein